LNENGSTTQGVPPVSVQFLVTNQCTTFCAMCDHFKLFKSKEELKIDEVFCTLDCIKDIGTTSIIISGGEPLARKDLFEILQYGKKIGLNFGLLTSGVMSGEKPLDFEKAKTIATTCSWVQLSIDSFNNEVYKLIRGNDSLKIAIESLHNIVKVGFKNIEVCFTIQKANIEEIAVISDNVNSLLPLSVPVRFKFAHGPSNGKDYFCSVSQHEESIRNLPRDNPRFNSRYLISIINDGYFDYEGLSQGMPVKTKMIQYRSSEYTCHAIRFTCLIDSNGDLYPCCYLFDDNHASSKLRGRSCIGTLRSPKTGRVMPLDESGNALAQLWYNSEKLKKFRLTTLPVENEACNYCTRYFYQNDYLNKLENIFKKYHHYGLANDIAHFEKNKSDDLFWL
jgi:MoaA/NifB/PqqE/SkfB family radical SAM enzyme